MYFSNIIYREKHLSQFDFLEQPFDRHMVQYFENCESCIQCANVSLDLWCVNFIYDINWQVSICRDVPLLCWKSVLALDDDSFELDVYRCHLFL